MADNSANPAFVLPHVQGLFKELTAYYGELTTQADPNDYNRLLVQVAYTRRLGELNNNLLTGAESFTKIRRELEAELDKPEIETPDGIRLRQMTASFIERAAGIAENRGEYQALKNIADVVKQPGTQAFSEGMERSAEALNKGQIFEALNVPDYRREWFAKEILAPVLDQFAERQKAAQMEQAQAAWKIRPTLLDDIEPRQRKIDTREATPQEAEVFTRQNHDQARELYETSLIPGERARRVDMLLTILRDPANSPLIGPGPEPAQAPVPVAPPTITIAPLPSDPEAQPAPVYSVAQTANTGSVQSHDQQIEEAPQTLSPQASSVEPDIDPHYNEQALAVPNQADYKTILQELVNKSQVSGMPVRIGDVLDKFGAAHRDIYDPNIAHGILSEILDLYGLDLNTSIDLKHENAPEAVKLLGHIAWIYDQHSGQPLPMVKAFIQLRNDAEPHTIDKQIENAMKELGLGLGALPGAEAQNAAANESPDTGGGSEDGLFTLDNAGRAVLAIGAGAAAFHGIKKYRNRIPDDEAVRIAHDVKEELKQKRDAMIRRVNEMRNLKSEEREISRMLPPLDEKTLARQKELAEEIKNLEKEHKDAHAELKKEAEALTQKKNAEYLAAKSGDINPVDMRVDPTFRRGTQDLQNPRHQRSLYAQDYTQHLEDWKKLEADRAALAESKKKNPGGDYTTQEREIHERTQRLQGRDADLEKRWLDLTNGAQDKQQQLERVRNSHAQDFSKHQEDRKKLEAERATLAENKKIKPDADYTAQERKIQETTAKLQDRDAFFEKRWLRIENAAKNYGFSEYQSPDGVKDANGNLVRPQGRYNNSKYDSPQQDKTLFVHDAPDLSEKDIKNSFKKIGKQFDNYKDSGTTASIAHVSRDGVLTVANVGDSPVNIYLRDPKTGEVTHAMQVTADHSAANPSEAARINKAGGLVADGRAGGKLLLSRALGDKDVVGITHEPDIKKIDLNDYFKKYEVIVTVDSDGSFEGPNNKSRQNVIRDILKQPDGESRLAKALGQHADLRGADDNVSSSALVLKKAPEKNVIMGVFDGHGTQGGAAASQAKSLFSQTFDAIKPGHKVATQTSLEAKEANLNKLREDFGKAGENGASTNELKSYQNRIKRAEGQIEAEKINAKLGDVNFKAAAGATTALAVLNISQRFSDAGLKDLQDERSQVFAATGVGIDALGIGADIRAMQAVKQATDASKVITSSTASAEALAAANKTLAQATKASRWLGAPVTAAVGVAQGAVEYNIGMNTGDTKRAADGVLNAAGGTIGALAGAAAGAKAGAMAGAWFGPMGITIGTIGGGLIGALTVAVAGGETAKWAGSDYVAAKLEKRLETLKEKSDAVPTESIPKPKGSEVMVKNENGGKGLDNANAQSSFNKQAKRGIDFAEESFLMTSGLAPDPHNDMKIKT